MNHTRRESDAIRTDIDALIIKATNVETKEILNLFRNMDDKLKDIATTLHAQNSKSAEYELKISKVLTSLEARLSKHEDEYNANKAKSSEWKKMISGVSALAVAFCAWAGSQYFDLHDSKEKTDQRLVMIEKDLTQSIGDINELRSVLTKIQIEAVKSEVTTLKKKTNNISKLRVIRASRS